jgi:hypothetical protein
VSDARRMIDEGVFEEGRSRRRRERDRTVWVECRDEGQVGTDISGQTLLHLLPHLDHELLLARLLAAGMDVNAVDVQGHTALHAAAVRKQQVTGTIAPREPVEE